MLGWLILVFAVLIWCSWRILHRHFAANLINALNLILSWLISTCLGWYTYDIAKSMLGTVMQAVLASALIGMLLFVGINWMIRRVVKRRGWSERLRDFLSLSRIREIALNGVLVGSLWCVALLVADILYPLYAPVSVTTATDNAGEAGSAGVSPFPVTETPNAAAEQAQFFARFSQGVRQTKQHVYDAVGINAVQHEIDVVRQIINLTDAEKQRVIQRNPQLNQLLRHPSLLQIVEDDELLEQFERFAAGRVDELVRIGRNSNINELLEDETVMKLIREIDLEVILRQAQP